MGIPEHAIRGRWPILREASVVRLLKHKIETLMSAQRFDVIHAHSPSLCGLAAWKAIRFRNVAFVYEIRSFWEDSDLNHSHSLSRRLRYYSGRTLEGFVVRRADAVVGIARSILAELEARKVPRTKLYHAPNGVDIERFKPRIRDAALAAELGVDGIPTLGFLGTFFPWEGVPWLVSAAVRLRQKGVLFKLVIIGDGADATEVQTAIRVTGSSDYISFLGRVPNDQVERYYSIMDVVVYPRRSARITELVTPLKPLEAMALGKAILGSGVGGIRELIEPTITGMLFEPGNIEDFCQQAARLLQQPELRRTLGEQARLTVLTEGDWRNVARRYEIIYKAAIGSARARL